MLAEFSIRVLADVRRFPGSRRLPHFNRENLSAALAAVGIEYCHFEGLGGRRQSRTVNSPNTAWRIAAFNAFADYMQTAEFHAAFTGLERLAASRATVIMCAEAVPWRCHRRLIADAFVARGWTVVDIYSPSRSQGHILTEFARVEGGKVTYPG
jgi:uncharacterized protein (DUF488 family)